MRTLRVARTIYQIRSLDSVDLTPYPLYLLLKESLNEGKILSPHLKD